MIETVSHLYEVNESPAELRDKALDALRCNCNMFITTNIGTIERGVNSISRRPNASELAIGLRHSQDGLGGVVLHIPDDNNARATVMITTS